jgi:hypothetical protein
MYRGGPTQRGAVLPFVALSLTVLTGFAGMAVDVGFWSYRQQQQQTATDAAALGGAQELARTSCSDSTGATGDATVDATKNGIAASAVHPNSPPASGLFAGNPCAITVQISTTNNAAFFARLFGFPNMPETTQATAQATTSGAGCIYLLSTVSQSNTNGAGLTAPNCAVLINDTTNFHGSTVTSPMIGYAGAAPNENGATFTTATPAPMLPVEDPCPEIAGCYYLANNPPSFSCGSYTGSSGTTPTLVPPGCYNSLTLNGANVTLHGIYVLNGSSNFNMSTITGTDVTIYVTAGATPPNFNKANISISAPSSGNYDGVLYYQVPANLNSPNFNSVNASYSGLIYAPTSTMVNYNNNAASYTLLVLGSANFNGSTSFDFNAPGGNQSLVYKAVVAQ